MLLKTVDPVDPVDSAATQLRSDVPTPNGGAYSIAYFRDSRMAPCRQDEAATIEIVEYASDGREIRRAHMDRPRA